MTREEAIFCEKSYIGETSCTDCKYYGTDTCKSRESHKMAIQALEQQPCDDAISREKVLEGLACIAKAKAKSDAQKAMMGRTMFFVEQLPSVSIETTNRCTDAISRQGEKNISKGFEDFMIKVLREQEKTESEE